MNLTAGDSLEMLVHLSEIEMHHTHLSELEIHVHLPEIETHARLPEIEIHAHYLR